MVKRESIGRKKISELRVVFDTSVLYNGSEVDLVRKEAVDLINENSQHKDIAIKWYLPEVVRHERQFQMQSKATGLLPTIERLERLLGHRLNITEDIVKKRVSDAVDEQMVTLGLTKLELDDKKVDWKRLILNACYRKLPFAMGEKEKGFRDSLIVEAFMQLVGCSPKSRDICRVVLVAGDEGLRDAVRERTEKVRNVNILESLEELKGLINTLVAEVTEQFVKSISERAKRYFFDPEEKAGIYYSEKIKSKIRKKFKKILEEVPKGAEERVNKVWFIKAPRFVKKEGQRVFWATRITVECEAYKYAEAAEFYWTSAASEIGTMPDLTIYGPTGDVYTGEIKGKTPDEADLWITQAGSTSSFGGMNIAGGPNWENVGYTSPYMYNVGGRTKELASKGQTIFEIVWSVILTTKRNFASARVESINYVATNWE